jgi:hypothetical protein
MQLSLLRVPGSLDTVTRFLVELQNERAQLNQDLERVLHEKVSFAFALWPSTSSSHLIAGVVGSRG